MKYMQTIGTPFTAYVAQLFSHIFVEVVFKTLKDCHDVTCVQIFLLELSSDVGALIVEHLDVEEKIEEGLPNLFGLASAILSHNISEAGF